MLTLVRWLASWPLAWLHRLGGWLGWLAYALSPRYRARLRANADQAGIDAPTRRAAVAESGKLTAELPWLWLGRAARPISRHVQWQGDMLIDEALATGRGLVLLTPHLGSFEVCAQAYAERWGGRWPMTALYRPSRQAWLAELEATARERPGLQTAPANLAGVRQMLRALKKSHTVGLLPDQVPPAGQGVWAPFFGKPAYTMTLAAKLIQQSGAAWLLMWAERLPAGGGWRVQVAAPSAPLPGRGEQARGEGAKGDDDAAVDDVAAATVINREMEVIVQRLPSQYLWGYRRYKVPRPDANGAVGGAERDA